MNLKAERGAATRDKVLGIATRLFAERGYDDTSIETVLQESGLSRGALYHHYAGKDALFEAVLEATESAIGVKIAQAVRGIDDPAAALRAGALAWIRLAGDPVIRRIVLIDAPAVLGWERWRAMEERYSFGMLKAALQASGAVPAEFVDLHAHMLLAAVNESALLVARGGDTKVAEAAVEEFLRRVLTA
ncbi:MAG: TetR/AcrR family transcriptional regulator [Nonomuraea sp.]|nr:TetR/AcrR family transcriptional regulator [Nonomuraea sp.]NUP66931.1 TetR/AcrR family transcriptional regulator [Nonomuraea sp.]NUP81706.1 TetR/AcrR family transcriptional regulator [Nonomuraea sp.]NUS01224.1 TetR/AcrR family transcriptional regulator [Nonomuraea sp.]NUT09432.1 TetR/AcrR family transcriptional regulator [Nonomuraea sp.]